MNELLGLAKPSTGNRRSTAVAELILKDRKEDYENLQPSAARRFHARLLFEGKNKMGEDVSEERLQW